MGVVAPCVRTPKNVALGYGVGKISAGCLVSKLFHLRQCPTEIDLFHASNYFKIISETYHSSRIFSNTFDVAETILK